VICHNGLIRNWIMKSYIHFYVGEKGTSSA
jgi:hypothetical protein